MSTMRPKLYSTKVEKTSLSIPERKRTDKVTLEKCVTGEESFYQNLSESLFSV